jgi:uncharacterized membrane protein
MLPDPLHPAVVHFPIVFMLLLPVATAGALWVIRRGGRSLAVWLVPCGLAAALSLTAWIAVETGESQEDRVERDVGESPVDAHAQAAERFLALSGVLLVVSGAGLLRGPAGRIARLASFAGAVALAGYGARVGHTGGKLVYQYGAASAYAHGPGNAAPAAATAGEPQAGNREDE